MVNPIQTHWSMVKIILRYLSGTITHGLIILPINLLHKFSLRSYSYSDWTNDPDERRSTLGYFVYFSPNLVSWSSKKQSFGARSSTKEEYRALAYTTYELL